MYSAFLLCVNHVVMLHDKHVSTAAEKNFFKGTASFPNYLFFQYITKYDNREGNCDDILSILSDLNAVVREPLTQRCESFGQESSSHATVDYFRVKICTNGRKGMCCTGCLITVLKQVRKTEYVKQCTGSRDH